MNKVVTEQDFASDLKIGEEMIYLSRRDVVASDSSPPIFSR